MFSSMGNPGERLARFLVGLALLASTVAFPSVMRAAENDPLAPYKGELNAKQAAELCSLMRTGDVSLLEDAADILGKNGRFHEALPVLLEIVSNGAKDAERAAEATDFALWQAEDYFENERDYEAFVKRPTRAAYLGALRKAREKDSLATLLDGPFHSSDELAEDDEIVDFIFGILADESRRDCWGLSLKWVVGNQLEYKLRERELPGVVALCQSADAEVRALALEVARQVTHVDNGDDGKAWAQWWEGVKGRYSVLAAARAVALDPKGGDKEDRWFAVAQWGLHSLREGDKAKEHLSFLAPLIEKRSYPEGVRCVAVRGLVVTPSFGKDRELVTATVNILVRLASDRKEPTQLREDCFDNLAEMEAPASFKEAHAALLSVLRDKSEKRLTRAFAGNALNSSPRKQEVCAALLDFLTEPPSPEETEQPRNLAFGALTRITGQKWGEDIGRWMWYVSGMPRD